jgi:hypothetical protein
VASDAGHDTIKRAYTDLAMRYHPDRQADSSADARANAEWHMREVNAAWEVLRNPGRRAAYDAELRGDRPVWERPGTGGVARPPRTAAVRPGGQVAPPPRLEHQEPSTFRLWPIVVLAVMVVGLVVVGVYANQQQNVEPEKDDEVELDAGSPVAAGDCVVIGSFGGRLVPTVATCDMPGAQTVVTVVDLGRPCASGDTPFDLQEDQIRLCLGG